MSDLPGNEHWTIANQNIDIAVKDESTHRGYISAESAHVHAQLAIAYELRTQNILTMKLIEQLGQHAREVSKQSVADPALGPIWEALERMGEEAPRLSYSATTKTREKRG